MSFAGLECREVLLRRPLPGGEERSILDGVSARFAAGQLSLITGPVGAGKTSLLHILSTILRPTAGEVLADGEVVSRYSPRHKDLWRRQLGLAYQGTHFLEGLSVVENVMAPLVPTARSLVEAFSRAGEELERFGIAHLAGRSITGLSGGERQRVTLARAFAPRPRFLLADEPTAHQDAEGALEIIETLAGLRAQRTTLVVVSHDPRWLGRSVVDARWELKEGRLKAAEG